jgi:predicted GNAT family N-acyltransferase
MTDPICVRLPDDAGALPPLVDDRGVFPERWGDASLAKPSASATFEIRELGTLEDLICSYRLRYEVYADLGYLSPNNSGLEIDPYDAWAIPVGAFDTGTGKLMGTIRLITSGRQGRYARLVDEVLVLLADDLLKMRARAPRPHAFPSIASDKIDRALAVFNTDRLPVAELSRCVVDRKFRGSGVARGLMERGLAIAASGGPAVLVGSFLPEHLPMYARYGYQQLPQTDFDLFDSVGRVAIAGVCRTDKLPQPTRSNVEELLRSRGTKAGERITRTDCGACDRQRFQGMLGMGLSVTGGEG